MKASISAPVSVPRLNSLRDRLEKTPGPEDESYLDQLMLFLDDPPKDTGDRWKAGAELCAQWGITTSGAAVHRLYHGYLFEWRICAALDVEFKDASLYDLRVQLARLVALRSCELLLNPNTPAVLIVKMARMEQREKALELRHVKHEDDLLELKNKRAERLEKLAHQREHRRWAADEFRATMGLSPYDWPPETPEPPAQSPPKTASKKPPTRPPK